MAGKCFGLKYVPKFQEDYFKLPWYERDLMSYYNHLKYQEIIQNPNNYFRNKVVVNFDIIHHECRGDPLKKISKEQKTIEKKDFKYYPKKGIKIVLNSVFRNIDRDNLWVQRDVMIQHFKENFK